MHSTYIHIYHSTYMNRDVAQWLEHSALLMSMTSVRFRIPPGGGLSEKYHVSPLSILGYFFDNCVIGQGTFTLTWFN